MEINRIARILYNMSLDMDYADYLDYAEEEIKIMTEELQVLIENNCASVIQALEIICGKNEDLKYWKESKTITEE